MAFLILEIEISLCHRKSGNACAKIGLRLAAPTESVQKRILLSRHAEMPDGLTKGAGRAGAIAWIILLSMGKQSYVCAMRIHHERQDWVTPGM